ncbi:MAG: hypothetical protein ACHQWH_03030, partial [Nitrososphaerales archaeon]
LSLSLSFFLSLSLSLSGHFIKNWKRRFFVIRNAHLLYYEDSTLGQLKGHVSIYGCKIIEEPDIYEKYKKYRLHC